MTTYYEFLRDPRWQRKRLEVMERDGFACRQCGANSKTLNVHHSVYHKGAMPWDYNPNTLVTLCEDCHRDTEADFHLFRTLLSKMNRDARSVLLGFARTVLREADIAKVEDDSVARGIALGMGVKFSDVRRTIDYELGGVSLGELFLISLEEESA